MWGIAAPARRSARSRSKAGRGGCD
jgi:hypothetical protein